MPCSDPSLRELSDHHAIRTVPQLVEKYRLDAFAEGERAEIFELAPGLMSHPRAINPDMPVLKRLRGGGLRRSNACQPRRKHEGQRDGS